MTVEMTPTEAELLIAILTGGEVSFAVTNPPLVEALKDLRPLRSALITMYLRERFKGGPPSPREGDPS